MGLFSRFKKSEKTNRSCTFCNAKIPEGEADGIILEKYLFCKDCRPKAVAITLPMKAIEEKRDMTIQELRKFDLLWKSKDLEEIVKMIDDNGELNEIAVKIPDNGTRYEFLRSTDEHLAFSLRCPHCAKLVFFTVSKEQLKSLYLGHEFPGKGEPSDPFMQAFCFLEMKEVIEVNCPLCKASVIALK